MKKPVFHTELSYLLGLFLIALGSSLTARSDFGVSMIVAPVYILHRKLSLYDPHFTFGVAEIMTQILVLLLLWIVLRKVRVSDLFCFISAVLYALFLDGTGALIALLPAASFWSRIFLFAAGVLSCATGVAMVFHTYIPCQSYDYFVKRIAEVFHLSSRRVKTLYDLTCLVIALLLSFAFFGFGTFIGIHVGTIITAFINGTLIAWISGILEKHFVFEDKLPLRKYCE